MFPHPRVLGWHPLSCILDFEDASSHPSFDVVNTCIFQLLSGVRVINNNSEVFLFKSTHGLPCLDLLFQHRILVGTQAAVSSTSNHFQRSTAGPAGDHFHKNWRRRPFHPPWHLLFTFNYTPDRLKALEVAYTRLKPSLKVPINRSAPKSCE